MKRISFTYLIIICTFLCVTCFASCAKEEVGAKTDLIVEQSSVNVKVNEATYMKILSGGGGYEATNSNREIAIGTIDGNTIRIMGESIGQTKITIQDRKKRKTTITVVVDMMEKTE